MMQEPTEFAVEKVLKKLGFKLKKQDEQPVGSHNHQEVILTAK
jgi:hypothetical protein